jgi:hypothetical protein
VAEKTLIVGIGSTVFRKAKYAAQRAGRAISLTWLVLMWGVSYGGMG